MSFRKAFALAVSLLTLSFAAAAQQGPTYQTLNPPQPTEGGGKIEVLEFFWYGCPHCYTLEAQVNAWAKSIPADVVFKRVHALPNQTWAPHATIFYTLESMNLLDKLHGKVFEAIHKENLNLANQKIREDWLTKNGVDVAKYTEVEKSFSVNSKMQRARQLTMNYKVDGVPRIFVNGRYYTAPEFAGAERTFSVVNELVALARRDSPPAAVPAPAPAKK